MSSVAPNLATLSPRDMSMVMAGLNRDDSNHGIEGYFNPGCEQPQWKTDTVGFKVPKMKRITDIERVADRESKYPTSDTYKSPFEQDWTSRMHKRNKNRSFGKKRRQTMTE